MSKSVFNPKGVCEILACNRSGSSSPSKLSKPTPFDRASFSMTAGMPSPSSISLREIVNVLLTEANPALDKVSVSDKSFCSNILFKRLGLVMVNLSVPTLNKDALLPPVIETVAVASESCNVEKGMLVANSSMVN